MFDTGPVLWLQSFESAPLTALFGILSAIGIPQVYVAAVAVLMFGFDLRRGLTLAQIVLWNDAAITLLKDLFALPRPSDVDAAVRLIGSDAANTTPFHGAGGHGLFGLPSPEAIAAVRARPAPSFGFPSGHLGYAASFWGGLWGIFRSPWAIGAGALFVPAIALSRIYLGRHFVADAAGGAVVGGAVAALGNVTLRRLSARPQARTGSPPVSVPLAAGLLIASVAALALARPGQRAAAGALVGGSLAILLLARRGLPREGGTPRQRLARVAAAMAIFTGLTLSLPPLQRAAGLGSSEAAGLAAAMLPSFAAIDLTLRLARRRRWYPD